MMATVANSNAEWRSSAEPVNTADVATTQYYNSNGEGRVRRSSSIRSRSASRDSEREGNMKWPARRHVSTASQSSINLADVDEAHASDSEEFSSDDETSDEEGPMSPHAGTYVIGENSDKVVVYHPRKEGETPRATSTPMGTSINRVSGPVKKRLSLSDVHAAGEVHKVNSTKGQIKIKKDRTMKKRASMLGREVVNSVKSLMGIEGEKGTLSGERLSHLSPEDSPKLSLEKRKFAAWWKVIAPQIKVDVPISAKDGTFHKENFTSELHLDQYLGLKPRTRKPVLPKRESLQLNLRELEALDSMTREELLTVIATLKFQEQLHKITDNARPTQEQAQFILTRMSHSELMNVATTLKARVKFMKNFQSHLTK